MPVAFPQVHEATVRMLKRAGLSVVVPAGQGCCGAVAVHAGELDFGRELAKQNIDAFERSGADVYVVNAAGCGSALKEYPRYFAADPQWLPRAQRFSDARSRRYRSARRRWNSIRGSDASMPRRPIRNRATSFTRSGSAARRAACSNVFPAYA